MKSSDFRVNVEELIEGRQWSELKEAVSQWPAPELAELVLERASPDRLLLFRNLVAWIIPKDALSSCFSTPGIT